MKKIIFVLTAASAICIMSISASAQSKLKMEIGYNISSPVGSFKNDFINKTSFRGATGEISYTINPKFSLGLNSGYQSYYQKFDRQTYKLNGNQTVSAVVSNTLDVTPLLLRGTYFPMAGAGKLQPYVSAGAGANMVSYGQYLGEFGGNETSATFAAQAGAGILIPVGKSEGQNGIKVGATYNYAAYNKNDVQKLNSIGIHAGFVFALK